LRLILLSVGPAAFVDAVAVLEADGLAVVRDRAGSGAAGGFADPAGLDPFDLAFV